MSETGKNVSAEKLEIPQRVPIQPIPQKSILIKTDRPRPYVCMVCTRGFARAEHLRRHERAHTQERPFSCQSCGKNFSRKDLLLRHRQKLHAIIPIPDDDKKSITKKASKRNKKANKTATEVLLKDTEVNSSVISSEINSPNDSRKPSLQNYDVNVNYIHQSYEQEPMNHIPEHTLPHDLKTQVLDDPKLEIDLFPDQIVSAVFPLSSPVVPQPIDFPTINKPVALHAPHYNEPQAQLQNLHVNSIPANNVVPFPNTSIYNELWDSNVPPQNVSSHAPVPEPAPAPPRSVPPHSVPPHSVPPHSVPPHSVPQHSVPHSASSHGVPAHSVSENSEHPHHTRGARASSFNAASATTYLKRKDVTITNPESAPLDTDQHAVEFATPQLLPIDEPALNFEDMDIPYLEPGIDHPYQDLLLDYNHPPPPTNGEDYGMNVPYQQFIQPFYDPNTNMYTDHSVFHQGGNELTYPPVHFNDPLHFNEHDQYQNQANYPNNNSNEKQPC